MSVVRDTDLIDADRPNTHPANSPIPTLGKYIRIQRQTQTQEKYTQIPTLGKPI